MNSQDTLHSTIQKQLQRLKPIDIATLNPEYTVLIISDMIKGFAEFGSLSSERIGALSKPIASLAQTMDSAGFEIVAFADAHTKESPEFDQYPAHCLAGSEEGELIEGLSQLKHLHLIHKNSTNGYLEPEFQRLLKMNPEWHHFMIVGNCTDICVMELALTLKAHFNRMDLKVTVSVPPALVNTYDSPNHSGDELHSLALYLMQQAGIELVEWVTI
jgi:nicotinamidase-related amidase